jgi:hypothetical protein
MSCIYQVCLVHSFEDLLQLSRFNIILSSLATMAPALASCRIELHINTWKLEWNFDMIHCVYVVYARHMPPPYIYMEYTWYIPWPTIYLAEVYTLKERSLRGAETRRRRKADLAWWKVKFGCEAVHWQTCLYYVHTYIYIHKHVYTMYVPIYIFMHVYVLCTYKCVGTCTCIYHVHTCSESCIHELVWTCTDMYVHGSDTYVPFCHTILSRWVGFQMRRGSTWSEARAEPAVAELDFVTASKELLILNGLQLLSSESWAWAAMAG